MNIKILGLTEHISRYLPCNVQYRSKEHIANYCENSSAYCTTIALTIKRRGREVGINNKKSMKNEDKESGAEVLTVNQPSARQLKQALLDAGGENPATITKLIITGGLCDKVYQNSEQSQEPMQEILMESTLVEIKKGLIPNQKNTLFLYILPNKKKENIILPCLQTIVILPKNIVFKKKDGIWYYKDYLLS